MDHVRSVGEQGLVPTGITGLDDILLGGIQNGNVVLVEGAAGTGKTTLGLEFLYRGVTKFDEPGLVVTFELSPQKLLRDASGFGWELEEIERAGKMRIIYTSPTVILHELQSRDGVLATEIARIGAKRVLIDGLTPLKLHGEAAGGRPFRDSLHLLVETLQRLELTTLLTRELPARDSEHEQFICDTVICLQQELHGRKVHRSLEVKKSRGQDFIGGRHTLRIEANRGVRVYPRAHARLSTQFEQPTSTERSSVGVPAVDAMLGGGVFDGSISLVVGISGTGKTVLGMNFLVDGMKQGKPGLMVTLDEHPAQIVRNATGLGLDFEGPVADGKLHIHYESPLELELDVHFEHIKALVERHGIKRVVIDSLAAYEQSSGDESRDFLYALATFFKDRLITAFFNYESPEMLGVSSISEELKASTIVDNIVLLNYVEVSTRLRRAITVPKARGSKPQRNTREFTIGQGGIALIDEEAGESGEIEAVPQLPFSAYYGVLARSPARRSPMVEERVMAGKSLPKTPKLKLEHASRPKVARSSKVKRHPAPKQAKTGRRR